MLPERFGIGMGDHYHGTLQSFGDLTEYKADGFPSLSQYMIAHAPHGIASAVTNLSLDHGNAVPLRLLFPESPPPFIPLYPCHASPEAHLRFGASLSESLHAHPSRIALIAAGDLSHHVSDASPEGRREEGMLFDKAVLHALKKHSIKQLLDIAYKFEEETSASGMRALLILLGILDDFHARFNLLSYEAPFGIGYAVAEYEV
jgi:aromatic ring-opening dioxygenase LigB subunit